MLKIYSPSTYADSYVNLPKAASDSKIIVSISTEKTDFNSIKTMINSVLDQTVHADQIIINIQTGNDMIIPDVILRNHILLVHKLSKNYGKCSTFLSPLSREKDAKTKIILLNDEQIYGKDFVENIIEESNKFPNDAIFVNGFNAKKFITNGSKSSTPINVIDVKYGVLIKPSFLPAEILETESMPLNSPNVVLSAFLIKNKVNFHQLHYNENFIKKSSDSDENDKKAIILYALYFGL
jgi:hypothetical protein